MEPFNQSKGTPSMSTSNPLLRFALLGDAVASGATGLLMAAAASPLSPLLGLPEPLLRGAGLVCLGYAAIVGWLGARAAPPRAAVLAVVAVNLLWALECLGLPALGFVAPNALGLAFLALQAVVVAGFAAAQWAGLRRAPLAGVTA